MTASLVRQRLPHRRFNARVKRSRGQSESALEDLMHALEVYVKALKKYNVMVATNYGKKRTHLNDFRETTRDTIASQSMGYLDFARQTTDGLLWDLSLDELEAMKPIPGLRYDANSIRTSVDQKRRRPYDDVNPRPPKSPKRSPPRGSRPKAPSFKVDHYVTDSYKKIDNPIVSCDLCDSSFTSPRGLAIHSGMKHPLGADDHAPDGSNHAPDGYDNPAPAPAPSGGFDPSLPSKGLYSDHVPSVLESSDSSDQFDDLFNESDNLDPIADPFGGFDPDPARGSLSHSLGSIRLRQATDSLSVLRLGASDPR